MELATVLFSGVVAGVVSALVSWVGGLHRDKRAGEQQVAAAEVETARRREDARRDRLTDAVVDFLATDRQRFDATWTFTETAQGIASAAERNNQTDVHDEVVRAIAEYEQPKDASANAGERIGLYAPALYDLVLDVHLVHKFNTDPDVDLKGTARREREYRAALDALLAAARTDLGIVPPAAPQRQPFGG